MAIAKAKRRSPAVESFRGLWLSFAIAVALVGAFVAGRLLWDTRTGSVSSLAFGWGALALLVAVSALGLRKRALGVASRIGAGRSRVWLAIHIHGGTLFLLLVLLHSDLGRPRGWVTTWLLALSVWSVASGLAGRALQRWIPRLLTSGLSNEVLYERIPELLADLRERSTKLAEAAGPEIRDLYERKIAPELSAPRRSWRYFVDITGGIGEKLRPVRYLRAKLSDEEASRLDELETLYRAKLELDAHFTLQQALRSWLWLHLPTSILLWVFVGLHLWGVLRY